MIQDYGIIKFTPLTFSFSMQELGGSLDQKYDKVSGVYIPDRAITPLALSPKLVIDDPDGIIGSNVDKTADIIAPKWYIGDFINGTLITAENIDYTLSNGVLQVKKNVASDAPVLLSFICSYMDPRTKNLSKFTWSKTLSSTTVCDLNLSIKLDCPLKWSIDPFKELTTRTIKATLWNGDSPVSSVNATVLWKVRDKTTGMYRSIDIKQDLWYVSGANTDSIIIDRRYIGKVSLMAIGNHKSNTERTVNQTVKIYRQFPPYEQKVIFTKGKVIYPDTFELSAYLSVQANYGTIENPSKFFEIPWSFKTTAIGSTYRRVGFGDNITLPREMAGHDVNIYPVIGADPVERKELQAITLNSNALSLDGQILVIN